MASPRLLLSSALLTLATAAAPAAAQASPLNPLATLGATITNLVTASDARCVDGPESQPFARWDDSSTYVPAPGGSFEPGDDAWSTSGLATLTGDNEPWFVSGRTADSGALSLSAGASASSPSFCGGLDHPTVRLFARSTSRTPATALVTVRYTGADDHLLAALPLGVITAGSSWSPTTVTATLSGLKLLTGAHLGVTVTALTGSVELDDVYVDPYRRS